MSAISRRDGKGEAAQGQANRENGRMQNGRKEVNGFTYSRGQKWDTRIVVYSHIPVSGPAERILKEEKL